MPKIKTCKCGRRPQGVIIYDGILKKYRLECAFCGIETKESRMKYRIAIDWNRKVGKQDGKIN